MSNLKSIGGKLKRLLRHEHPPTRVDVLTGYAHWAESYPAQAHNPLMEIEEQAMMSLLPDLEQKTCLDLGCGSGRYLKLMQTRRAGQVFGLDYSPHMLAKALAREASFSLVRAPLLALPFAAATFDVITCALAVGHEKNLTQVLAEVARLLQTGGSVIYSDFHPFATLVGWQRSFTAANGTVLSLEHYLHLYSAHHQACQQAGLTIEAVLEPRAGEHVPPGSEEIPVVLVIRAVKKQ